MARAIGISVLALALSATAAGAATQADCTAAVRAAQHQSTNSIILRNDRQKSMRFSQMIARAIGLGQRGDYDRCLQMVRNARGGFGLPK